MSDREILAYAITHAPPGVKGGPYEAKRGGYGDQSATLKGAAQWRGERDRGPDEEDLELARMMRDEVRWLRPDARVIRIVRADVRAREASLQAFGDRVVRPSEASAVAVLRELASYPGNGGDLARIQARARRVLASAGPDPSEVVRAAMAWGLACKRYGGRPLDLEIKTLDAVDAYRKAGGK